MSYIYLQEQGGGILGSELLGHRTVCAVEIEKYPREVLLQRQRDGILPRFPIWDDICTFDGKPWRGIVDIVAGGFPCQDISSAGKGAGIEGERSGLWGQMARVVREVRPRFVFVENSPMLTSRGLYRVLGDLAELGYDARWCVLGADDTGAPHRRKRIWILAYPNPDMLGCLHEQSKIDSAKTGYDAQCKLGTAMRENAGKDVADTLCKRVTCREPRRKNAMDANPGGKKWMYDKNGISWWQTDPAELPDTDSNGFCSEGENKAKQRSDREKKWISERDDNWPTESRLGRVAHGVADRVDRLKAIGNGQVPAVAATAWTILSEGLV